MGKGRLEAFSDGVIAIIITIMVLEIKVPHGDSIVSLKPLLPVFLSYVLSFLYVAIYWNNHHNMLHAVQKVSGSVLWANAHLLFWLSLVPFATAWMGENHFAPWPVAAYGFVLFMCGFAYYILARCLAAVHGKASTFAKDLDRTRKEKLSLLLYPAGMAMSFFQPLAGFLIYAVVALVWLIPDKRFEKKDEVSKAEL